MEEHASAGARLISRLSGLAARRRAPQSPARRRALLGAAGIVLAVGLAVAVRSFPKVDRDPRWWLLGIVGVLGPLVTAALNGAEYMVQARLVGLRVPFGRAIRVSILASAANLLPLPGSVVVRTGALTSGGAGLRKAVWATFAVGVVWIGATGLIAGSFQIFTDVRWVGLGVAVVGVVLLAIAASMLRRNLDACEWRGLFARAVAVEASLTLVGGLRFLGVLVGFGFSVAPSQAVALTLAGVIATASGVFPGGIGIREALAAAVSPLVGLPAAVGLVAAAADRVAGLAILAAMTGVLVARGEAAAIAHDPLDLPPSPHED